MDRLVNTFAFCKRRHFDNNHFITMRCSMNDCVTLALQTEYKWFFDADRVRHACFCAACAVFQVAAVLASSPPPPPPPTPSSSSSLLSIWYSTSHLTNLLAYFIRTCTNQRVRYTCAIIIRRVNEQRSATRIKYKRNKKYKLWTR